MIQHKICIWKDQINSLTNQKRIILNRNILKSSSFAIDIVWSRINWRSFKEIDNFVFDKRLNNCLRLSSIKHLNKFDVLE
jgi:hypothetical protein